MKLDPARSRLAIYTEAEGLFSALAHDLEIVVRDFTGEASEEREGTAEIRVAPAAIRVSGVMKRGKLDASVLSDTDREAIERQIRDEVLRGPELTAHGTLEGSRAVIEIRTPRGTARVTCDVVVTTQACSDGGNAWHEKRARGLEEVSLSAVGAPPVKGPMGECRVYYRFSVEFVLLFA